MRATGTLPRDAHTPDHLTPYPAHRGFTQRTVTDERVNQVTPALFAKADCPEQMIQLSVRKSGQSSVPAVYHHRNQRPYTA